MLHQNCGGIAIAFPGGKAVSRNLYRPPQTGLRQCVEPCLIRLETAAVGPDMDTAGCGSASEQPVTPHNSIAIFGILNKVLRAFTQSRAKNL